MKCIITGANAKLFARAVQALSKIGGEFYLEANLECLSMRTVNEDKSAFGIFRFYPSFFLDYDLCTNKGELSNKCKVSMKACLACLKQMNKVEQFRIFVDPNKLKLIIQVKYHSEQIKTYYISIIDIGVLQAVYTTDNVPNKIRASFKLFCEIFENFQISEQEVTIKVNKNTFTVMNYVEGSHVDRRFMRSESVLSASEFDKFQINEETSITFCIREVRALLNFAEAANLDVILNFETTGRPVVFIAECIQSFEANLVMSTLLPEDITICRNMSCNNKALSESRSLNLKRCSTGKGNEGRVKKTRINETSFNCRNNELFNFGTSNTESIDIPRNQSVLKAQHPALYESCNNTKPSTNECDLNAENVESEGICVTFKNTEDINQEDDYVPESPTNQRKEKIRLVFKRCFEETISTVEMVESNLILAKNSDTED